MASDDEEYSSETFEASGDDAPPGAGGGAGRGEAADAGNGTGGPAPPSDATGGDSAKQTANEEPDAEGWRDAAGAPGDGGGGADAEGERYRRTRPAAGEAPVFRLPPRPIGSTIGPCRWRGGSLRPGFRGLRRRAWVPTARRAAHRRRTTSAEALPAAERAQYADTSVPAVSVAVRRRGTRRPRRAGERLGTAIRSRRCASPPRPLRAGARRRARGQRRAACGWTSSCPARRRRKRWPRRARRARQRAPSRTTDAPRRRQGRESPAASGIRPSGAPAAASCSHPLHSTPFALFPQRRAHEPGGIGRRRQDAGRRDAARAYRRVEGGVGGGARERGGAGATKHGPAPTAERGQV